MLEQMVPLFALNSEVAVERPALVACVFLMRQNEATWEAQQTRKTGLLYIKFVQTWLYESSMIKAQREKQWQVCIC